MAQFATKADLDRFLGITTTQDRADLALQLASAAIQNYTRQRLERVDDDIVSLRGNWSSELWLPERPVEAVSEVKIGDAPVLGTTLYRWDRKGLVEHLSSYWGGHLGVVQLKYTHGFEPIPDDIKAVCLQVASRLYDNPEQAGSETIGRYSYTYPRVLGVGAGLNSDEADLMARYRYDTATSVLVG